MRHNLKMYIIRSAFILAIAILEILAAIGLIWLFATLLHSNHYLRNILLTPWLVSIVISLFIVVTILIIALMENIFIENNRNILNRSESGRVLTMNITCPTCRSKVLPANINANYSTAECSKCGKLFKINNRSGGGMQQ